VKCGYLVVEYFATFIKPSVTLTCRLRDICDPDFIACKLQGDFKSIECSASIAIRVSTQKFNGVVANLDPVQYIRTRTPNDVPNIIEL
jgi:hypothetical protein